MNEEDWIYFAVAKHLPRLTRAFGTKTDVVKTLTLTVWFTGFRTAACLMGEKNGAHDLLWLYPNVAPAVPY